ncbi:preprotein translocase subunit YajC [Angustibacter sp. McL0619]|uniref:preprotein translocase subunit YajC n=1 Tax=Angustibacter sp. McL0619 TaxID=3415676 RepID=UPI003CEB467D
MKLTDLLIFALPVILLVFLFQSQRKRQRTFSNLQDQLAVGQEVLTTAGLYGRIVTLDERVVVLETGPGQTVRWDRRAIASVVPDSSANTTLIVPDSLADDVPPAPKPPADPASDAQNDEK